MQKTSVTDIGETKTIQAAQVLVELPGRPIRYYRHGWQSWSLAAWTDLSAMPVQKPVIFHPLQLDPEYVWNKLPHGSWVGAVEFEDGNIVLLGALGVDAHVFLDREGLSGRFESTGGEWFVAYGPERVVFEAYAEKLGDRLGKSTKERAPRVWCSWYSLYHAIDEAALFDIFDGLGDLPFDVLQVDDGWQVSIGDWEANRKFPAGMKGLAEKIRSSGRTAGLWLAPLIATASSNLFRGNPEWFLRTEHGRLLSAGFGWGEQLYALDTTHPDVREWLARLMKQVRAWGFDYLKLDFLYAGALKGRRHSEMPREAAYRNTLQLLREAMGSDAFFLACGTPIIPAIGLCDAIRVGPDVAQQWEKYRDAVLLYNPTTPATRNAIRTVIHRLWLKPLVHIDPDVAYFADTDIEMTRDQKTMLQDLALICDFKATSDVPQWMSAEEREQLRTFLESTPKLQQMGRYTFKVDDRAVDLSAAAAMPQLPAGFARAWGAFLGWLGSIPLVLKVIKRMDDTALRKRRERFSMKNDQ